MGSATLRIGLISDTHGLLRPEATAFLHGCQHIIHAGDIGGQQILAALAELAPVSVVRGNNDHGGWADALPETLTLEFGGISIHVLHDLAKLDVEPAALGIRVVVTGHSHKPAVVSRGPTLYVNPGSAGPRRFKLPVSIGELLVADGSASARIVDLLPHGC